MYLCVGRVEELGKEAGKGDYIETFKSAQIFV